MLEESPEALQRLDENELLVGGIVIRLGSRDSPGGYSDSEDEDDANELCVVQLEGRPEPQRIRFLGYNAEQLADRESDNEQEFLLMSREVDEDAGQDIYNALLLIEQDGDVAKRVGVASLRLESVEVLDSCKPEKKLLKLR